jgi:hypothetical protein
LDTEAIRTLLREAVAQQQLKLSLHAAEEALAETITRPEIEAALQTAQVLEDYPDWWSGPACLIYGQTEAGRDLHLVVSYSDLPVTIITAYLPRPPKWVTPTQRGDN